MENTIHFKTCPLCNNNQIKQVLTATDFTVSHQDFELWQCNGCGFRFTQNIPSQKEIGAFYKSENYISHSNQNKGLIQQLYHLVRKQTLQSKKKLIQTLTQKQTGSLLDIGAGTGYFPAYMQASGWRVTAIEPDETARKNAEAVNKIQLLPAEDFFTLPQFSFDCITLWHVLEHVHQLHEYAEHFYKLLKPHGRLIIAVPNHTSYDANLYKNFWAAYDVPRHLWHFSPESMEYFMNRHNFKVAGHYPMWFDSYYVCMLSEKYKTGKLNVFSALINGYKSNRQAKSNVKKCSSVIYCLTKQ